MANPSVVPPTLNVELDHQLQQEVNFFLNWGYLVVDNAATPEQIESLRAALDESYERNDKSQFIGELLEEDDRFAFLLDNPPVLKRMEAILGTCVQLHSATARITEPGTPDQHWHRDGPWPVAPNGTPYGSLPAQINCGYYLDEVTDNNGPTVIQPGSHRAPFRPPPTPVELPDEKRVLVSPGQAVMFDGWTWHRGAANNSSQRRRVCLMCYQNAWMKSREPFDGPRVTKLREAGTPQQQLLLGAIPKW